MPKCCSVYGCSNTSAKTQRSDIIYYSFSSKPHKHEQMKKWIRFCKRKNPDGSDWAPNKTSFMCSSHFIGNEKSDDQHSPNYYPTIRSSTTSAKDVAKTQRYQRLRKRTKKDHTTPAPVMATSSTVELSEADHISMDKILMNTDMMEILYEDKEVQTLDDEGTKWELNEFYTEFCINEKATQVSHKMASRVVEPTYTSSSAGNDFRQCIFSGYDSIKHDEKKLKALTGVTTNVFSLLLRLLPKHTQNLKYELTRENRLLIFLIKIKSNLSYIAIASYFDVCVQTASSTFVAVLSILVQKTRNWIVWRKRESVNSTMPECFKQKYNNCRVIIDCTEIKTEKPSGIDAQVKMWSDYKGSYTVKYLVGINPNGHICFMSKGYGGRSSDTAITKDCGILEKLEYGDMVMSDKGFPNLDIKDNVTIVMPPFSSKKNSQFSVEDMAKTFSVASVRIHVERAIGRLKIYNILCGKLSTDLLPYIDDIFHMCCVMTNFQSPIIKQ